MKSNVILNFCLFFCLKYFIGTALTHVFNIWQVYMVINSRKDFENQWQTVICEGVLPIKQAHQKFWQISDLFRWEYGDVVLVDDPGLLLHHALICLFPELVTRQPEEHVLLTELGAEKLSERVPPSWTAHQLVEGLSPGAHLIQRGLGAAREAQPSQQRVNSVMRPVVHQ